MSQSKRRRTDSPDMDAMEEERRQYHESPDELDKRYPDRPHNHSLTLPFSELFESLFNPLNENKSKPSGAPKVSRAKLGPHASKLTPHEQRRQIIERFISRWRSEVGNDFYPALRLILPDKDRDRGVYGLKENTIGKLLVKLMKINKNSEDGYNLLHWKLPGQTVASRMAGDFAGRCYEVLAKRPLRTDVGDMRIGEVNELLSQLSGASGETEQLPIFEIFYHRMSPEEMQWLIRIVLKQLKVGATEKTFLDVWHPDAEALFSVSSSLQRVCWELWRQDVRLDNDESLKVTLFGCFQPQLAQFQISASFQKMIDRLKVSDDDPEFWIEEKLDGERMQLHMKENDDIPGGRQFCFWSRKAKDYTHLYGDRLEGDGQGLTCHLKDAFADGVENLILDGEMITWDPNVDKIMPFGTLKTAANAAKANPYDESAPRPLFRVFDILYLNDKPLTGYTLRDRRRALEKVMKDVHRRLEILPYVKATSADAIEPMLRQIVEESSEGLVLKNPRSAYRLNSRNDDWIKVKPEYMSEFGESLDVVVIGGYWGSGRRGGILSSFLCGLRVSENHIRAGANPEKCLSFFKVGGGFTMKDYDEVRHHTEGKWIEWDAAHPPSEYIELAGGEKLQYERPDVWIRPKDSIVLSAKAASVAPSDSFAVRETLRFPRFRQLRLDRAWDSALDIDQFQVLRNKVDEEVKERKEMSIEDRRARRSTKRVKRTLVIAGQDENAPAKFATASKSKIFKGMEFSILSEALRPKKRTKAQLETLIKENGGTISQRHDPGPGRTLVADKKVVTVASIIKRGGADIIRPRWLMDCLAQSDGPYLLPYEKSHLLHATEDTETAAEYNADEFNDSFARDVNLDELREILAGMPKPEEDEKVNLFDKEQFLGQLEERGRGLGPLKGTMLSRCRVYFAGAEGVAQAKVLKLQNYVRFGGGSVAEELLDDDITHVVVVSDDTESERQISADVRHEISSRMRVPRLVTQSWVGESWKESTMIDEEKYVPR